MDALKNLLTRGVAEVIDRDHLAKTLSSGKKLRVKLGIDPTSPDLHLGHAVLLRKLRQFQNLGHTVIFLIGDFTARIGDPSGRSEERKVLTEQEIKKNMKTYLAQAGKIVNLKKAEVRKNSEWYKRGGLTLLLEIARGVTITQVLRREDFDKRLKSGGDVSFLESLYPLMQGYDSVALKADVELGGNDQTFNLLMGRRVQRHFGVPEQDVVITPLVEGTDGVRKMSKSFGNHIPLTEKPNEMFGKLMAIPDALIPKYRETLTDLETLHGNPRDQKLTLAETIVSELYSPAAAKKARENWISIFSNKELPKEIKVVLLGKNSPRTILYVLHAVGILSNSKSRELLRQGAIERGGEILRNEKEEINNGDVLKIGKKTIVKIEIRS